MAGAVDEILFVSFGPDVTHSRLMEIADPRPRLDFRYGRFLGVEHDLVNLALTWSEFSGNRVCSRHIRAIAAVLRADIDHDDVTALHAAVVFIVMKYRR